MDFEPDPCIVPVSRATGLRRLLRRACFTLGIVAVLLTISAVIGLYDISAPVRYRWQLIDRLKSVQDREGMTDAVGSLGVVLDHSGGAWTAITYKDLYTFGFPSVAVARMSDGSWFISRRHHCGLFSSYQHSRERAIIFEPDNPARFFDSQDERIQALHLLEQEPDAAKRAEVLAGLGFRPL